MNAATTAPAVDDLPPRPTRRGPAVALLVGSAALIATVLLLDLYGALPQELASSFAPFGPPGGVMVVVIVLAEGMVSSFLVAWGRHPLDGPYITHYGTRTLATGGVAVAAGMVIYLVWATAREFVPVDPLALLDSGIVAALVGASLLLSGAAVLATSLFSPWVRSHLG